MNKAYLYLEMILLFIGIPLFLFLDIIPYLRIPLLLLFTIFIFIYLFRNKTFQNKEFLRIKGKAGYLKQILPRIIIISVMIVLLALLLVPHEFLFIVKELPLIWLLIIFLYPLLSAYPQEIIYRAFFYDRYGILFPDEKIAVIVNAFLFSFLHIIYKNPVAILLTFFAGLLFAVTYRKSNSVLVVAIEHSIYGILIFTFGLGMFFYNM